MSLTEEQRHRMEENRLRALQLRALKQKERENIKNYEDGGETKTSTAPSNKTLQINKISSNTSSTHSSTESCNNDKIVNKVMKPALVASCALISPTRFVVNVSYHAALIDLFKTFSSRAYDSKDRLWNFSINEHDLLMKKALLLKDEVVVTPLPKSVLQVFRNASEKKKISSINLESKLEPRLLETLFPFQYEGVCFGIGKGGRVLLADDMGLGKTIQAMGIAAYYKNEWPLLVVAPSSVRYAWHQSFLNWMPSINPQSIIVVDSGKDPIGKASVLIMSYELVVKKKEFLLDRNFQVIIVDESHFMKSYKSSRTLAVLPLLKKAKRVCMLSGTPALSRPSELFTQLSALCPKVFFSFHEFGMRYCDARKNSWGYDYSGASNMTELHLLMEEVVMIRRLKSDVLSQLPEKRREMVILDPNKINNNTRVMNEMASQVTVVNLSATERRGALLLYYNETGTVKLEAVCDYLSDLLESEKKFLCFAHHLKVLDGVCYMLNGKKCKYIRIDGRTNAESRNQQCEKFQKDDSYRVAVLSITAANMGITLTAAHLVVFAELFWNPGILTQAENRAHRIGQMDSVLVQYLVAKGTADDYIWPLVTEKLNVLNRAGLSEDDFRNADLKQAVAKQQRKIDEFFADEDLSWLDSDDAFGSDHLEEPSAKRSCATLGKDDTRNLFSFS